MEEETRQVVLHFLEPETLSFVVPLLSVLLMALVELFFDSLPLKNRLIKVGWDLDVLALGMMGGIIYDRHSPHSGAAGAGLFFILLIFGMGIVIGHLRRTEKDWTGLKAMASIALGGLSLALPLAWTYLYIPGGIEK